MSSSSMRIITSSSTTRIRLACVAGCTSVAILHPAAGTGTHLGRIRLMMHCGCPGAKGWKRRREGMEDSRTDAEVLQAAVLSLVYQALGESEIGQERLRYV